MCCKSNNSDCGSGSLFEVYRQGLEVERKLREVHDFLLGVCVDLGCFKEGLEAEERLLLEFSLSEDSDTSYFSSLILDFIESLQLVLECSQGCLRGVREVSSFRRSLDSLPEVLASLRSGMSTESGENDD